MIGPSTLAARLRRLRAGGWSVWQRRASLITVRLAGGREEVDGADHIETELALDRDFGRDRGTGVHLVRGDGATEAEVIEQAWTAAAANRGPAWETPPATAPARVALADVELGQDGAALVARRGQLLAAAGAAGLEVTRLVLTLERGRVEVSTSSGLRTAWDETLVDVDLTVAAAGSGPADRPDLARWQARRRRWRDLDVTAAVAALRRRADIARVGQPAPAAVTRVVFDLEAYGHGGVGLLAGLIDQHDAEAEAAGLTRYRLGHEIVAGASRQVSPLTVISDGAAAFAPRSAPVGRRGEGVRRFELIEGGRARGVGLDLRAAARRGTVGNGGVRNLILTPGSTPGPQLLVGGDAAAPVLHVHALSWLEVDARSGLFVAGVAAATALVGADRRPIAGGTIHGDAVAALALAERSREVVDHGELRGPALIAVGAIRVTP
jgi:predicted Zn-dependent protease